MKKLEMNYFYCRGRKLLISTTNTNMEWYFIGYTWEKVPYKRAKKIAKRLYLSEETDGSFSDDLPF